MDDHRAFERAQEAFYRGDLDDAREMLKPLVENNHPAAVRLNASFFPPGVPEPEMDRIYVEGVQRAAELGDAEAQYLVGSWYDIGEFGFEVDKFRASEIFRQLAAKGHSRSMWIYACDLLWGRGAYSQDIAAGVEMLESAISAGSAEAAMTMAQLFGEGLLGFSTNVEKRDLLRAQAKELAGDDYVHDPYEAQDDA